MNKQDLKTYLKENLKIEAFNDFECDSKIGVIELYLEGELISSAQIYTDW